MMRGWLRFLGACSLGVIVSSGCGGSGDGGAGGAGGGGGSAGMGGAGGIPTMCTMDEECDDGDPCTEDTCTVQSTCEYQDAAEGTECAGGSCVLGECLPLEGVFPCNEQGIRAAVAAGGGPNGFSCEGPQTVTTEAEIIIDTDVILDGLGNLTVDGNDTHTVFSVATGVTAQLHRLGVTRGSAAEGSGGGIRNRGTLTLVDVTVTESIADNFGGGVANFGTMTMTESNVNENTAGETGGGVFNSSVLTLTDTTLSGNTAAFTGGGVGNTGSSLTMTGCTVSGNQSVQNGGGVWNQNILHIANSTLSGNDASVSGGGIQNASIMTMLHVTVTGNTASTGSAIGNAGVVMNMGSSLIRGVCSGTAIGSDGYNIESPGNTCGLGDPTDAINVSSDGLRLEPLQDNGGPTQTHAILSGSTAADRIPAPMCESDEDQRGVARPQGSACDVGAFELEQ